MKIKNENKYENVPKRSQDLIKEIQLKYPEYSLDQLTLIISSYFSFVRDLMRNYDKGMTNIVGLGKVLHLEEVIRRNMKQEIKYKRRKDE